MNIPNNEPFLPLELDNFLEDNDLWASTLADLCEGITSEASEGDEPHDDAFYSVTDAIDTLRARFFYDGLLAYLQKESGDIIHADHVNNEVIVRCNVGNHALTCTIMINSDDKTCFVVVDPNIHCPKNRQSLLFWHLAQLNVSQRYGKFLAMKNGEILYIITYAIGNSDFNSAVFESYLREGITNSTAHLSELEALCTGKLSEETISKLIQLVGHLRNIVIDFKKD